MPSRLHIGRSQIYKRRGQNRITHLFFMPSRLHIGRSQIYKRRGQNRITHLFFMPSRLHIGRSQIYKRRGRNRIPRVCFLCGGESFAPFYFSDVQPQNDNGGDECDQVGYRHAEPYAVSSPIDRENQQEGDQEQQLPR